MNQHSPDDFAAAMKDRRPDAGRLHGVGGDGGNGIARGLGLLLFGLGVAGAATQVWFPLVEARDGAASLWYLGKVVLIIPGLILAGLALLALGARVVRAWSGDGDRSLRIGLMIGTAIALAAGIALRFWLEAQLASLGYAV